MKNGLFRIVRNSLYGYINGRGEIVRNPEWSNAEEEVIFENLAVRNQNGHCWCLSASTLKAVAFDHTVRNVTTISDTTFAFEDGSGFWGIMDADHRVILEPAFESIGPVSAHTPCASVVKIGESGVKHGLITPGGETILEPGYAALFPGDSELIAAQKELLGPLGYIDWSGKWRIEPKFSSAQPFRESLAGVTQSFGEMAGYIDESGAFAIQPRFAAVAPFSGGCAAVTDPDGGMYYIDHAGQKISDTFTACGAMADGRAPVYVKGGLSLSLVARGGYWTFLDENFRRMKGAQYLSVNPFRRGLAQVFKGAIEQERARLGYIDRDMNCVWKPCK